MMFRHCERSEAIQTAAADTFWIASLTLAIMMWRQFYRTTDAVCPNRILRSSSVRIAGLPKFGLTSFASA